MIKFPLATILDQDHMTDGCPQILTKGTLLIDYSSKTFIT